MTFAPDEPPFDSYTLLDLRDVALHIDARRFPERATRNFWPPFVE